MDKLKKIWKHRQLLFFLSLRDVKVRYKQTFFGIAWAVITPLTQTGVFVLIFDVFFKISPAKTPYLLTTFVGLVFWNFFVQSISSATTSLTANAHLVKRANFPKEILVISAILGRIPDLLVSFFLILILLIFYKIYFSIFTLWIFLLFFIEFILATGIGLILSTINVYFRDINAVVPLLLSAWLFLTPIIYPLESLPSKYQSIAKFNPMTGIIEGVKRSLLTFSHPELTSLFISIIISILILILGFWLFKKLEKNFADVI